MLEDVDRDCSVEARVGERQPLLAVGDHRHDRRELLSDRPGHILAELNRVVFL